LELGGSASGLVTGDANPHIFRTTLSGDYVFGDLVIQGRSDTGGRGIYLATGATPANRIKVADTGDISFYEDTGTTAKFFWDANEEALRIGSYNGGGNPSGSLFVESNANNHAIHIEETGGNSESWQIGVDTDGDLGFYNSTSATASVTFDDSGNVGIGTSSPASLVSGGTSPVLSIGGTDSGLTTGEKAGSLSFITNDSSYTYLYADGITGEIASIAETAVGGGYGMAFYTGVTTDNNRAERLRISMSGNVGIGTSTPSAKLHIEGGSLLVDAYSVGEDAGIFLREGFLNIDQPSITVWDKDNAGVSPDGISINGNDGIRFRENGGEVARFDDGNFGIGTDNPVQKLHIENTSAGAYAQITSGTSSVAGVLLGDTLNNSIGRVSYDNADNSLQLWTSGAERLRIDSSGRVGIGGVPNINWRNDIADQEVLMLGTEATFYSDSGVTTELFNNAYVDNSDTFKNISTRGASRYFQYDGAHKWFTAASASAGSTINTELNTTPKMILDVSGNLLVNRSSAFTTAKTEIQSDAGDPLTLALNSIDSDGNILSFYKAGTTVGSIGTEVTDATLQADLYVHARSTAGGSSLNESRLWLLGGDSGIVLDGYTNAILPTDENSYEDNRTNIGSSDYRFKNLYLSGGVVFNVAGGTGTSTSGTLDDYEEGTFTPTAFGTTAAGTTTYTSQTGSYTKVGDTVHVDIYISWTAMTGTGDLRIGGLPFTSSSASNYYATGAIVPLLGFTWPSGATQINPIIAASGTAMSIFGSATDFTSYGASTDNEVVGLAITLTYKV
jgi:hypothetical protein